MGNLTLKHLRYFDALATHGHFGRAAGASSISQPALSMQIRELEETLGTPLLERGPRSLRLTAFGEEFLTRARAILRQTDELDDLARAARSQLTGRLRIGVIPTVAPYLLPGLVARLTALYPALDLTLRETITPRLLADLGDGRLDCAVLALPISEPAFEEVALFSETFVLVRPLAEADKPVPDRDGLREMRLLLLEEGHCFRNQALSFCAGGGPTGARPKEMMDGSSLSTLVQMVGAGIGVTLIPEMAVAVETRSAPVSVTAFPDPQPQRMIGMLWRRSTPLSPQLRQIADVVRGMGPKPPSPPSCA